MTFCLFKLILNLKPVGNFGEEINLVRTRATNMYLYWYGIYEFSFNQPFAKLLQEFFSRFGLADHFFLKKYSILLILRPLYEIDNCLMMI